MIANSVSQYRRTYALTPTIRATSPILKYSLSGSSGAPVPTIASRLRVHALLKHGAGLEAEHAPPADHDGLTRLRVASLARALFVHDEIAKARYLHLLAALELMLDQFEDRIHHLARFFLREADLLMNPFDDVRFGQRHGILLTEPCAPSLTQLDAELATERRDQLGMQRIHFLVGQCAIGGAVRNR